MDEIDLSERDLYLIHSALKGQLHKLVRTVNDERKSSGARHAANEKKPEPWS